ncbi:unnamed protein product, partial [Mesorhabditis belari]|uniref:BPTI/Kunitz inhibitor domain-containing protein n=1 Tax=Mesorhabditis belari TaxID=2138241 RepID=A0AAF3EQI5_9BILA
MCKEVCVEPPKQGRCYLRKNEGPLRCDSPTARYYYDHNTKKCEAFWWRGCLGNANNFQSWEECSTFCKDVGPLPVETTTEAPRTPEPQIEVLPQTATEAPQQPQQQPVVQPPRVSGLEARPAPQHPATNETPLDEVRDPRRDPIHPDHRKFQDDLLKAHEERHRKILEARREAAKLRGNQERRGSRPAADEELLTRDREQQHPRQPQQPQQSQQRPVEARQQPNDLPRHYQHQ